MENKDKILQVDELNLHFKLSRGLFKSPILIKAVDNISFSLFSGEHYVLLESLALESLVYAGLS